MENTNEKKGDAGKMIPRNPNKPITDDEVNSILEKAAKQIAGKEKTGKEKTGKPSSQLRENNAANKVAEPKAVAGKTEGKSNKKPEEKGQAGKKPTDRIENKKPESGITDSNSIPNTKVDNLKRDRNKTKDKSPDSKKEKVQKPDVKKPEDKSIQDKKADAGKQEKKDLEIKKPEESKADNKKDIKDKVTHIDDFKVEKDVIVTKQLPQKEKKVTIGGIIGGTLEFVWTVFKLAVFVTIVTVVVGFFMSRDLMIRGRSGERLCTEGMQVTETAAMNKTLGKESGRDWSLEMYMTKHTLEADDGSILVARRIVTDMDNDKWAVILHGHNETMENIYDIAMHYTEEGYNVLMPDLRACGESEGSFYGMGWLDRLDIINWVDVILQENPSAQVVIHGVDVGANAALMLAGEPLKDSIKAIVAEGAYTNAREVIEAEYKARHPEWPVFPIVDMMNPVMKVWAGYTLKEANTVAQVQKASVPILLIRGQNDTYITEAMTTELDQAIASEHEVITITGGTHGDCRYADPDAYYDKTFEFVGKYIQ